MTMGYGYRWHCSHCEYTLDILEGEGKTQFLVTTEVRDRAIAGELGEKLKTLLQLYPDCVIETQLGFYRCPVCGRYENTYRYRFRFIPIDPASSTIRGTRILKDGTAVYHYRPTCSHCQALLRKSDPQKFRSCPICGEENEWRYDEFLWD